MTKNVVNVGLLGLGTVGTGVFKVLQNIQDVKIKKIADKDITRNRNIDAKDYLTTDVMSVLTDPDISIIIEVIGGTNPAFDFIKTAIENGKHVVTANKELLAKRGSELFELANKHNVLVLYEASVGGGIPIIMPVKQSLTANKFQSLAGILNGTTNYILTKMEKDQSEFADVLAEAQELGYAEADPTSDVEGHDAAYKIAILASIAFGKRVDVNNVYCEGISKVSPVDIAYAAELGYKIKLIAMSQVYEEGKLDIRVHPALVSKEHPLASINGVTNALTVYGDAVGEVNFSGPGAGELPTASAVVGDVLAIAREIPLTSNILPSMRCKHTENADIIPMENTVNSYYVRIHSNDTPGVIGNLGLACGNHGVSLSGVIQKDILEDGNARIIILTHEVKESAMRAAINDISKQSTTKLIANMIRVFK